MAVLSGVRKILRMTLGFLRLPAGLIVAIPGGPARLLSRHPRGFDPPLRFAGK